MAFANEDDADDGQTIFREEQDENQRELEELRQRGMVSRRSFCWNDAYLQEQDDFDQDNNGGQFYNKNNRAKTLPRNSVSTAFDKLSFFFYNFFNSLVNFFI